jgi:hemolysin activation/secretion protein
VSLRYDSLDNLFTPTRGTLSDTSASFFDDAFGGTRDFQLLQQVLIRHWPLSERIFLGARAQANFSFGDVPFYARPFIYLRGIPALRYQGEHAATAELELRWQFHPRISLIGFGGGGLAWTNLESFDREQSAFSGGLGVRYLVARKFGMHAGLDVARGPEEGAIYVQLGNAWIRP